MSNLAFRSTQHYHFMYWFVCSLNLRKCYIHILRTSMCIFGFLKRRMESKRITYNIFQQQFQTQKLHLQQDFCNPSFSCWRMGEYQNISTNKNILSHKWVVTKWKDMLVCNGAFYIMYDTTSLLSKPQAGAIGKIESFWCLG